MVAVLSPEFDATPDLRLVPAQVHGAPVRPAQGSRPAASSDAATYRRRRVVAGVLAAAVLLAGVWLAEALVAAVVPEVPTSGPTVIETAADAGAVAEAAIVVAQPGDTLWTIARRLQPAGDVRPLVQRLSELNGGAQLVPGQAVRLP